MISLLSKFISENRDKSHLPYLADIYIYYNTPSAKAKGVHKITIYLRFLPKFLL